MQEEFWEKGQNTGRAIEKLNMLGVSMREFFQHYDQDSKEFQAYETFSDLIEYSIMWLER